MSTIDNSVLDLEQITENWIADRAIAPDILQRLEADHDQDVACPIGLLNTAPGVYCEELDLPQGSAWVEVRASLLDACHGLTNDQHLNQVRDAYGLDEEGADQELG